MGELVPTFRSRREERFYRRLRNRVRRWAQQRAIPAQQLEYLLVAPDLFVLLSRLALDRRVPIGAKARITAGIAYFLSPLDLTPDFLGPAGFLDDVVVAAWVIHSICAELNAADPSILLEHWEGEQDLLWRVTDIVARGENILGHGLRLVAHRVRGLGRAGPGQGRSSH